MPRPTRIEYEGALYHVFNRGISKKTITFSTYHKQYFLYLLEFASKEFDLKIHAYCLMGNHYHLMIETPDANLSKAMQYIGSLFATKINEDLHADGALFRGRYKAILVDSEQYFLRLSRYIHLNPLEIEGVKNLEDYEWSSYKYFKYPQLDHPFLQRNDTKSFFKCWDDYYYFIGQGVDDELQKIYKLKHTPSILGSETFKKELTKKSNL